MTASSRQPALPAPAGIDAQSVVLIFFRHKWKILLLTLAGFGIAAAAYFLLPPVYESSAKLLVRYVVERSAIDSVDSKDSTGGIRNNDSIINSEMEILTSWDLATEVAEAVGAERLASASGGGPLKALAAHNVASGLSVSAQKGSNVITVSFRHRDPEIASTVLSELLNRYFTKHLEVHRSLGAFEFVTQQTDQVRGRLRQTEEELKQFKTKTGIISLPESMAALGVRQAKSQEELMAAEADRAEQLARVKELERWLGGAGEGPADKVGAAPPASKEGEKPVVREGANEADHASPARVPSGVDVQIYQAVSIRLSRLRQTELELLSKYTPENDLVQQCQKQIASLDAQKHELETHYPTLATTAAGKAGNANVSQIDLISERARLSAIEAKTEALRTQVREIQETVKSFSETGTQIAELERRKEVEETNYKYFESSLEKARIDEALDPSKIPNINVVQKPTPPAKVVDTLRKLVLGIAAGGMILGLAIAFFIDLLIDKTVKAPSELETKLRIPVMRSIPYLSRNGRAPAQLQNGNSSKGGKTEKQLQANGRGIGNPSRQISHQLRPFCNEIRDRIILHFEVNRLNHKPKLIAVTGCSDGVGTSTIAAGLAASLSETGDDKVLLVDMNLEQANVPSFFEQGSACLLTEAIEPGKQITSASDNLYLATAAAKSASPIHMGPKKFYDLLPRLKASDFDYIIFDMPPLSESSATIAMAGFMDKTLLVIEAEKDNRDAVKRAYADLMAAKANVSSVVNKTRSYAPKWVGLDS